MAAGRAGAQGAMRCAGVFPKSSTAVTSAPRLMSHLTTSSAPAAHARCMAVRPPSAASCASLSSPPDEGTRASMSSARALPEPTLQLAEIASARGARNRRVARRVRSSSEEEEEEEEGIGPGVATPNDREPRARRRVCRGETGGGLVTNTSSIPEKNVFFGDIREKRRCRPRQQRSLARPWRPRAARSRGSPARLTSASCAARLPARLRPRRMTARTRTR